MSDTAPRDKLVRSIPFALERSDAPGDGLTLRGHGAVFNEWTTIDSWEGRFKERIAPGAFRKTIEGRAGKIRLQFDHGQHPLIGSLPIGTINKLREDSRGLFVEATLADNWLVQPVREAIANGSIDGMSFRFTVEQERWDRLDSDMPERTITEVRLMEVGPVVWPAYEGTDVGVRSLELARSLAYADDTTRQELARVLLLRSPLDTPEPEAAAGTSEPEAVSADEPVEDHSRSDDPVVTPYKPAQPVPLTRDRMKDDLRRVTAAWAAASARSA